MYTKEKNEEIKERLKKIVRGSESPTEDIPEAEYDPVGDRYELKWCAMCGMDTLQAGHHRLKDRWICSHGDINGKDRDR